MTHNGKGDKLQLKACDLVVFKDKAEDIIGVELESYIQFLINNTHKSKLSMYQCFQKERSIRSRSMKSKNTLCFGWIGHIKKEIKIRLWINNKVRKTLRSNKSMRSSY